MACRIVNVTWGEVTAVFGGRFDPPHVGHREAVRGLFQTPGIRDILILPSPVPAYQPPVASLEDRLQMARLCFASSGYDTYPSAVAIDPIEIIRSQRHPQQPTYTYDTLLELRQSRRQLAFVIGVDQLIQLPKWHRFPEILSLSHWIVLERKSVDRTPVQSILQSWEASGLIQKNRDFSWQIAQSKMMILVPTDAPALSSTQIREELLRSGSVRKGVLSPEVVAYLKEKRLYGMGHSCE